MGKIEGARSIWIGTQADTPYHPFEKILNGTAEYVQVYSASCDAPPFQRKTWRRANSGLDQLPDLEAAIRREAKRVRRDPQALSSLRALRLNQGVSDTVENVIINVDVWREIETEEMADGVDWLYLECAERDELLQAGLKVSDLGALLEGTLRRWREAELRQELVKVEYTSCQLVVRGMGFMDGGQDVREFRARSVCMATCSLCVRCCSGRPCRGQSADRPSWQQQAIEERSEQTTGQGSALPISHAVL